MPQHHKLKEFLSTNRHELLRIKTGFSAEFRIYSRNSLTPFLKFMMLSLPPKRANMLILRGKAFLGDKFGRELLLWALHHFQVTLAFRLKPE